MWNLLRQATRWLLNQPGHTLDIRESIDRLAPGLEILEKKIRRSLNDLEKVQVQEKIEPLLAGGMPKALASRAASLHLLYPALDVVESAARRDFDVLDVATVFFGLGDRLGLKWLRESVEKLPVEGQWHAHARGNLRDELYFQHRKLAGRVLETCPDTKDPVNCWIKDNADDVERVSLMMKDMHNLPTMDYATVSVAVRSLDQLLLATGSS
jgi:glutamate dehydrogenase